VRVCSRSPYPTSASAAIPSIAANRCSAAGAVVHLVGHETQPRQRARREAAQLGQLLGRNTSRLDIPPNVVSERDHTTANTKGLTTIDIHVTERIDQARLLPKVA
jgi:hypothetical protein